MYSIVAFGAETASCEALDGPVLVERLSPMSLPVWPCFITGGLTIPGLPGLGKVAALKGVLGAGGNHGFFRDGYLRIICEVLAVLLLADVDGEWE
jgi:hypothetical protein